MKKIIITGGAGFIGSHLVDLLISEGEWDVSVIDNLNDSYSSSTKFHNIERHLKDSHFRFFKGDIEDEDFVSRIFKQVSPSAVVHFAARDGIHLSIREPNLYEATNIRGTLNLLEAARRFELGNFIFGSSSAVYGFDSTPPFNENDCVTKALSPYAMTKIAGEMLCHTYSHLYGLRCVCLRFSDVYGARQRPDSAVYKFTALLADEQTLPIYGNGLAQRDYVFIDDLIFGVRAAIDYRKSLYEIINLGNTEAVELRFLISLLENTLGIAAKIKFFTSQKIDLPHSFSDINKARQLLGYNPQTDLPTGIKEFVYWFLNNRKSNLTDFERFKQLRSQAA